MRLGGWHQLLIDVKRRRTDRFPKVGLKLRDKRATGTTEDDRRQAGQTSLLGEHSKREPPDPIPNSEVKPLSADDSVAVCHAKVGNCQALKLKPKPLRLGFFLPQF